MSSGTVMKAVTIIRALNHADEITTRKGTTLKLNARKDGILYRPSGGPTREYSFYPILSMISELSDRDIQDIANMGSEAKAMRTFAKQLNEDNQNAQG